MTVPSLFDQPGLSHRADPATSVAAAKTVTSATRLALLRAFDGLELTDDEAGEIAHVGGYSQRRRCSELRGFGLIEPTGVTRATASGSQAQVCRITAEGRRVLAEAGR